jgi:hypothetical protein
VSYALYALTSLLVLLLARRRLPVAIAGSIALLFAVHPLHVEAVALAAGQSELLVGVFCLAAVVWYQHLRERGDGRLRARHWAGLATLYLLACASKETGFVLPLLLLVAEFSRHGMERRRLWGGFLLLAAVSVLMFASRTAVLSHVANPGGADALAGLSFGHRALTMLQVIPIWTRLLLWPAHLRVDYSPQEFVASTEFGAAEGLGLLVLVAACWAIWHFRRRAPPVSFGLAWVAVSLLPVSNLLLPTGILVAERTLFLPSAGFLVALGGVAAGVEAAGRSIGGAPRPGGDASKPGPARNLA